MAKKVKVVEESAVDQHVTVNMNVDPNDPRKLVNGRVDDGEEFEGAVVDDPKAPQNQDYPDGSVVQHLDTDPNDPRRKLPGEKEKKAKS